MSSGTIPHALRTLATMTRLETEKMARYRLNMFIWMLTWALQLIVALAVWQAVAQARPSGTVGSYDAAAFAGYYLVLIVTRLVTTSWSSWQIAEAIEHGTLSDMLVRPASPLVMFYGVTAGTRVVQIAMSIPLAAVCWVVFHASVSGSPAEIAVGMALLLPGAALAFFIDICIIGIPAFWITRIHGISGIYFFSASLFGGVVAPIPLLPDTLRHVAYALPFYWVNGYPSQLIVGKAQLADAPVALGVCLAWLLITWAIVRFMWPRALRRYEAVGG